MELRQLEHFLAVADEQHFTRAAQRMHIVQSGLSSSIRALESELGAQLFVRNTRSVRLTHEGQALVAEARRTLRAAESAKAAVAGVAGGIRGRLTVGIMQCYRPGLPQSLSAFHTSHPKVELRLLQAASTALVEQVASGAMDLAFACVTGNPAGVCLTPLDDQPMSFACNINHRCADQKAVRLEEVAGDDFVDYPADWGSRTLVDAFLAEQGLRRSVACEVGDTEALLDLVEHGLGVAVIPPFINVRGRRRLRVLTIDGPAPRFPTAAVTPATGPSAAANILLETVVQHARRIT